MKPADTVSRPPPDRPARAWIEDLRVQAEMLDGIEVGMCAFDEDDCAVAWNRSFLRMFPEHDGHVQAGEPYAHNLRRFYERRLDASEIGNIDRYIAAGVARHRAQAQPYEFEHGGRRLQVSSLPVPGRGRIRVWRSLDALPAPAGPAAGSFAADVGAELLDYVPEALVVCAGDGRILWANASFCQLFRIEDRERVLGATVASLYDQAWQQSGTPDHPARGKGVGILREHLRFAGAPFELALPGDGCCRVIARPARDGAVFHALIDISELKQYEAALQLTLDNAGRGIIRYDAAGRVQLFNQQALQLLALDEDHLSGGAHIRDIVRFQKERGDFKWDASAGLEDADGASIDELAARLFVGGRYLRHTPSGRVLEISTSALPDGGAVRTYSDVTEYVQAQRALSEKTRALQITLDNMTQGISAIDGSGRLVFWNRRYQELLDLPESLLAQEPTMDQVVRFQIDRGDFGPNFEFVDAVARGYVAVGDKLAPIRGPETYLRKTPDGRTFDVSTRPLPDGGVVRTFTDITAYVRTQEELARKQAQLGALVNTLPDRVWLKDERGTYLLTNPAHRRYHGLGEAEILGRTAIELFGPEKSARQAASDRSAMASAAPVASEEYDFGPDGNLRCAEVVKVAMRDEAGECIGLLGIARDITRRKQAEAALIKAKEEAQEASGAKSRFLSSMSHEIRTPMNAVLGMLTLLRSTSLTPRQEDYAGKAEGAARALLSLLNDILDFSKIEAGKMRLDSRPFSLEGMLSDLSVILSSNVGEKDIELLYDLDPGVPDGLVGDDMRLRQILINLGGNAVKFTERGEVVVRTRLVDSGPEHASVEFSVQDTGIGISAAQQAMLFGDYVQATDGTARQFGGTGLGLGICRRLTDLMGATLQLESTDGVGSRFWFTLRLPLAEQQVARQPALPQPQRVLIVDDNPLARETLAGLARSAGWHADTAGDGAEALQRLASATAARTVYDVVFVDWVMPGMDGWQTCTRIRRLPAGSRTPLVIMVTGNGREMLDRRPTQEQAMLDGFLVKPVTAGMLQAALRRALQSAGEDVPAAKQAAPQPLAGLRLLVAEDNPVNQQIATELLARQGAQVEVVENGRLAVDAVLADGRYDAVLMDVQMPVMDGLEATRELRRRGGTALPIIAMTANAMDTDRQACMDAGMDDHVAKPFAIEDVVDTLLKHLAPGGIQARAGGAQREAPSGRPLPVFDRAGALERMGGDESLLAAILPVFCGNLETAARDLATADARSADELCRLMHSIKGMAANLGAGRLAALAAQAEERARDQPAEPPVSVDLVAAAIAEVLQEIARQAAAEEDFW